MKPFSASPRRFSVTSAMKTLFFPRHHKLRSPEEGPLNLRVWKGAYRFLRGLRISCGTSVGRFQRSIAPQNFHDLRVGHAIESAIAQDGFDLRTFLRGAAL